MRVPFSRLLALVLLSVFVLDPGPVWALELSLESKAISVPLGQPVRTVASVTSNQPLTACGLKISPVPGLQFAYRLHSLDGRSTGQLINEPFELAQDIELKFLLVFASTGSLRNMNLSVQLSCRDLATEPVVASAPFRLSVLVPPIYEPARQSSVPLVLRQSGLAGRQSPACPSWESEHLVGHFDNILLIRPQSATFKPNDESKYPRLGVIDIGFVVDEVIKGTKDGINRIEGWVDANKPTSSLVRFDKPYLVAADDGVLHWQTCSPKWVEPVSHLMRCKIYRLRRLVDPPIEEDAACEAENIEHYLNVLNVQAVLLNQVERLPALKELWFQETRFRWDGGRVATEVLLREPHKRRAVITMTPERLETLR